jgi:hypothetical protein
VQCDALALVQAKRDHQLLHGAQIRSRGPALLKIPYRAEAHPRLVGELALGETRGFPVPTGQPAQQFTGIPAVSCHPLPPPWTRWVTIFDMLLRLLER